MAGKIIPLLVFVSIGIATAIQPYSPYSLQAAVDALHRRQLQLSSLRENVPQTVPRYDEGNFYGDDLGEMAGPYANNRQQMNRLLASYLDRDEEMEQSNYLPDYEDTEDFSIDKRKRSMFRERDARERDIPEDALRSDLAEEFLREIDRERNFEREEKQKETLRRLWETYQQQENEIEHDLFDEDNNPTFERVDESPLPMGPMYWNANTEKKRTYPILPWLPASRRKRFPVTKRSSNFNEHNPMTAGTNDKVVKDLKAIFEAPIETKKKRSSNDAPPAAVSSTEEPAKPTDQHASHDEHGKTEVKGEHESREETDEYDPEEHGQGHDHEHDHDHDHDHEHEHDEDEDDEEGDEDEENDKKKKKRDTTMKKSKNLEIVKEDQIIPGDISDSTSKKSVKWNQYFGLDRRKKDMRYPPLQFYKSENDDKKKKKKMIDENKLENMDEKLKNIEDVIIDDTVKYTGAHEGISDPKTIEKFKDHVVSRLATAYNLEKMRRALEKLRYTMDEERHLQLNQLEPEPIDKKKRIAIKKEKAEFDHAEHNVEDPPEHEKKTKDIPANLVIGDKKKKRNPPGRNDINDFEDELGAGHFEPLNENYMGGRDVDLGVHECPILDSIERRCRGVDVISGDIHQEFLSVCAKHQICYLCGTSATACDFHYLSDIDPICGHHSGCHAAARSGLMILRGIPNPQLGPQECAKNPCLYQAMSQLGY